MDEKKAYPAEHPIYSQLRTLGVLAAGIFSGLSIGPYSEDDGALCVRAAIEPSDAAPVELRLWRPSVASPLRLRVGTAPGDEAFHDVADVPPAYGLDLDESEVSDAVLEGMAPLTAIHRLAEEAHRGLEGSGAEESISLMRLNEAVAEGIMARLTQPEDDDFADADNPMDELDDMIYAGAVDADFESVRFNGGHSRGRLGLSTIASMTVAGNPVVLQVWAEDEDDLEGLALAGTVNGAQALLTEDGFVEGEGAWPGGADDHERISEALESVGDIHLAALEALAQAVDEARTDALDGIGIMAAQAVREVAAQRQLTEAQAGAPWLAAAPEDVDEALEALGDDEEEPGWYDAAEAFTAGCRLPFLGGVTLQDAPGGALDIAATILDPVGHESLVLKVYWHAVDPDSEPEHWYAVGSASGRAHREDPDLLSGFHPDSRAFIAHSLEHLHAMSHYASEVVIGKVAEARAALASFDESVPELAREQYISDEIEDAIEGLSGIARLYSGSLPE